MTPADMALLCFSHRSRKAARAVTRVANRRLKPLNLQITQFILMGSIICSGDRSIAALAEDVGVEPSAVLRNLKVLEERGLVAGSGGRGRSGRKLWVTPAGQALIAEVMPLWGQLQADLSELLGGQVEETREALVRLERAAVALADSER